MSDPARWLLTVLVAGLALLGLVGCGPKVWTAQFYNNTTAKVIVEVRPTEGAWTAFAIDSQDIQFVWLGSGATDLEVSVFNPECARLASRTFTATRYALIMFDPGDVITLANESSGVGPDPTLSPEVDGCS